MPTAGELANKALSDTTKYDPLEVGYAINDDLGEQLQECINTHNKIFDMEEYCVCYVLARDPLIHNALRRKFYAFPYLPSPRPNQTVYYYNKVKDEIRPRPLWVLPNAETMIELYLMTNPAKKYETMKRWSMAFFDGCFWEYIRRESKINMLSESEFLQANREELIKAGGKLPNPGISEPLDLAKIAVEKVVDSNKPVVSKYLFDDGAQTESLDRNITL